MSCAAGVNGDCAAGVCGAGAGEAHSSSPGAGAAAVSVRSSASCHAERSLSEAAGRDGAQISGAGRLGRVPALHTASRAVSISHSTTKPRAGALRHCNIITFSACETCAFGLNNIACHSHKQHRYICTTIHCMAQNYTFLFYAKNH